MKLRVYRILRFILDTLKLIAADMLSSAINIKANLRMLFFRCLMTAAETQEVAIRRLLHLNSDERLMPTISIKTHACDGYSMEPSHSGTIFYPSQI